jgi:acylphosphatase
MNPDTLLRLHAIIEGRVQGVGYRAFVAQKAGELDLRGWVRNRWEGTVEVVAEGNQTELEKLLEALHQGPRMAFVSKIKVDWEPATGEYYHFSTRSTL